MERFKKGMKLIVKGAIASATMLFVAVVVVFIYESFDHYDVLGRELKYQHMVKLFVHVEYTCCEMGGAEHVDIYWPGGNEAKYRFHEEGGRLMVDTVEQIDRKQAIFHTDGYDTTTAIPQEIRAYIDYVRADPRMIQWRMRPDAWRKEVH